MAKATTSYDAISGWAREKPGTTFLNQPFEGDLLQWTWSETRRDAARLAGGLLNLGLEPGDRVALLSKNCAEWIISDAAMAMAGLVSVPIYPTAGKDMIAYAMEHSGAKAIIIGKLDKPDVPDEALSPEVIRIGMRYPRVDCQHDWSELVAQSEELASPFAAEKDDMFSILYTSGSTGKPKGVVISYGAYQYASQTTSELLDIGGKDRMLSYLPLSHITERTVIAGPAIYGGAELFFADSLATFLDDLLRANVTAFVSVPRLWVQFQAGVHAKMPPEKLQRLLKIPIVGKIVARKIRKGLGLANARLIGSGSAPISPSTLRWYEQIGVDISEGWGMSETCGLSCGNNPFRSDRIGTIGVPIPGTEIKLSEEGEILISCPGLFTEYYKDPELTKESFTEDGFFKTGDKGEWDEKLQAFRITGRVKDQFKSGKGKYVAPVPIESKIASNSHVEQVCVMGSGLRAPVAVVVLTEAARSEARELVGAGLTSTFEFVNSTLESHEVMSHMFVVEDTWTVENALLTPTLKIKRHEVEAKYAAMIRTGEDQPIVWK